MILVRRDDEIGWLAEWRRGGCTEDAAHELAVYADDAANAALADALSERMERFYWRGGALYEMLGKVPSEKDRVWEIAAAVDLRAKLAAANSLEQVKEVIAGVLDEADKLRRRIDAPPTATAEATIMEAERARQ